MNKNSNAAPASKAGNAAPMHRVSYKQAVRAEKQNFIYNLVSLREKHGWKQQDMIRLLEYDIKFKTYQAWEEQRAFPPVFVCRLIARLFREDMDRMFAERLPVS